MDNTFLIPLLHSPILVIHNTTGNYKYGNLLTKSSTKATGQEFNPIQALNPSRP